MGSSRSDSLHKVQRLAPLAFLVQGLGFSQEGFFLTHELNFLLKDRPNLDISIFYESLNIMPTMPHFAMYPSLYLWGFKGIAIATCISTAIALNDIPSIGKKFFYVYDLEWIYNTGTIRHYANIYNNPNIELIARSIHHAEILTKTWKAPKYVIKDFNKDETYKLLTSESSYL